MKKMKTARLSVKTPFNQIASNLIWQAENVPSGASPHEQDEVLISVKDGTSEPFLRIPSAVPHCDCRDKRELGAMQPTEADKDGCCTLCGNYVFMKPEGKKKNAHGTLAMYKDGCRCEVCRNAQNMKRENLRQKKAV